MGIKCKGGEERTRRGRGERGRREREKQKTE